MGYIIDQFCSRVSKCVLWPLFFESLEYSPPNPPPTTPTPTHPITITTPPPSTPIPTRTSPTKDSKWRKRFHPMTSSCSISPAALDHDRSTHNLKSGTPWNRTDNIVIDEHIFWYFKIRHDLRMSHMCWESMKTKQIVSVVFNVIVNYLVVNQYICWKGISLLMLSFLCILEIHFLQYFFVGISCYIVVLMLCVNNSIRRTQHFIWMLFFGSPIVPSLAEITELYLF